MGRGRGKTDDDARVGVQVPGRVVVKAETARCGTWKEGSYIADLGRWWRGVVLGQCHLGGAYRVFRS